MPPIEVGTTRAIGAVGADMARKAKGGTGTAGALAARTPARAPASTAVTTSDALDPGAAPVDTDRVSQIRKAIESGDYPLVPARIADAMIAAGMFLRTGKP